MRYLALFALVVLALLVLILSPVLASDPPEHVRAVSTSDTQPPASLIPPLDVEQPAPPTRAITSTAYCLRSKMSNGEHGYEGAVAMNGVPLGTLVTVDDSPVGPGTFTVTDRHAPGSTGIDFYVNDCWLAQRWGRHTVEASILGHRADEYRP